MGVERGNLEMVASMGGVMVIVQRLPLVMRIMKVEHLRLATVIIFHTNLTITLIKVLSVSSSPRDRVQVEQCGNSGEVDSDCLSGEGIKF